MGVRHYTPALADSVIAESTSGAGDPAPSPAQTVTAQLWHATQKGGKCRRRHLSCPSWEEIRDGYASRAAGALDRLAGLTASTVAGRLLLLHGPPGTGKTTAVRALARAWRPWCELHVVLDPENLFASPSYLMELALGDDDERAGRWRGLLLEDCDELVGAGAKDAAGQALARLLNLTRPARPRPRHHRGHHHQRAAARAAPGGHPTRPLPGRDRSHQADQSRGCRLAGHLRRHRA